MIPSNIFPFKYDKLFSFLTLEKFGTGKYLLIIQYSENQKNLQYEDELLTQIMILNCLMNMIQCTHAV